MSTVTAKVNGVELTEAQVADAMRQIERAKAAELAARPLKPCGSFEAYAFRDAALALGLPSAGGFSDYEVRANGPYRQRAIILDQTGRNTPNFRIVNAEGYTLLTFGEERP